MKDLTAAKEALFKGENFLAYDIAESIPDASGAPSPQKIHVMALALARSGSLNRAQELVAMLPNSDDPEIAGLKSRIYKDMAIASPDASEKRKFFLMAAKTSGDAFASKRSWYNGINAASCLFLAGENDVARHLVRDKVLPACNAETYKDFWLEATIGECWLLLGNFPAAISHYSKATTMATEVGHFGSLASTLRQLRILVAATGGGASAILQQLPLPRVAVFSGHVIDPPNRKTPRFPLSAVDGVRQALRAAIGRLDVKIGFSSCACGGDILFMEEVLSAKGECTVAPPLPIDATIRNCVALAPGDWVDRLEAIRANQRVRFLPPECEETGDNDDMIYDFTNRYLLGLAIHKAHALGFPLVGICVWDGTENGTIGGTAHTVRIWREHDIPVEVVTPDARP